MGWDDNGLNVERRVQLMTGTIVDPSLPYDPDFRPPETVDPKARPIPVSRPNFIELCEQVVPQFEESITSCGRRSASRSTGRTPTPPSAPPRPACRNSASCVCPSAASPTGRVADAVGRRHENRRRSGRAAGPGDPRRLLPDPVPAARRRATPHRHHPSGAAAGVRRARRPSRRRALPATVRSAGRPRRCSGRRSRSSPTSWPIPRRAPASPWSAPSATRPTSSGGASCRCRCGLFVQRDGRLRPVTGASRAGSRPTRRRAQAAYDELAGKTAKQAQARIVELLSEAAATEGEPRPITHPVKFWENGTRPLEIVTSHQWFIRYPPRTSCSPEARSWRGGPTSCGSATRTGSTASSATGTSPGSASSASPSRSGTRSTTTAWSTSSRPSWRPRTCCRSTPPRSPRRASTSRSATSRVASRPTPTSWTPGPPRR